MVTLSIMIRIMGNNGAPYETVIIDIAFINDVSIVTND